MIESVYTVSIPLSEVKDKDLECDLFERIATDLDIEVSSNTLSWCSLVVVEDTFDTLEEAQQIEVRLLEYLNR